MAVVSSTFPVTRSRHNQNRILRSKRTKIKPLTTCKMDIPVGVGPGPPLLNTVMSEAPSNIFYFKEPLVPPKPEKYMKKKIRVTATADSTTFRKSMRLLIRSRGDRNTLTETCCTGVPYPINMPRTVEFFNGSVEDRSSDNVKTLFMAGLNLFRKPDSRGMGFQRQLLHDQCELYKSRQNCWLPFESNSSPEKQINHLEDSGDDSSEKAKNSSGSDSDSSPEKTNKFSPSPSWVANSSLVKTISPSIDKLANKFPVDTENRIKCNNEKANWDINMMVVITPVTPMVGSTNNNDEFSNNISLETTAQSTDDNLNFSTNKSSVCIKQETSINSVSTDDQKEGWQNFDAYMKRKLAKENNIVTVKCGKTEIEEAKAKLAKLTKEWDDWLRT